MTNSFKTIFFFLIISSPVIADESEVITKLRETIKQAFVKVEDIVFKKDVVPKPVVLVKCECKGTGFITHGDGHKTPCPNYPGCTKGTGQVAPKVTVELPRVEVIVETPKVVKPEPAPTKLNAHIKMYSLQNCAPCKLWKGTMKDRLIKSGWTVEVDEFGSKYSMFPTFEVFIDGKMDVVKGFLTGEKLGEIKAKYGK